MALNISGFDEDVFFAENTAASAFLFLVFVLPPLVLCILCVLALIYAKEISKKVKVLLINVLAAEIVSWLRWTSSLLGFPLRFRALAGENWICSFDTSLAVSGIVRFTAVALYAVEIYIFIKYGEKKVKWYVIIPFIAVSWLSIIFTFGLLPYFSNWGAVNNSGFCANDPDSTLFKASAPFAVLLSVICLITVIVCCVLTKIYIRKNTLEENVIVKKAVTNVLTYHSIYIVLSLLTGFLPATRPAITEALGARSGPIAEITIDYVLRIIFMALSIPHPVINIIFLKAIRDALKEIGEKTATLCVCSQDRIEEPKTNHKVLIEMKART